MQPSRTAPRPKAMQLPDVRLEAIADPATRQLVAELLNAIEALAAENASLRFEVQRLRDENARLKGGSAKPDIKPPTAPPPPDHSSEAERRQRTPRGKPKKNAFLTVTRSHPCTVDRSLLPPDAVQRPSLETIVQDIRIEPEVIRFVREVWELPATGERIVAPLPPGYHGGFGPSIRTFTLSLAADANISQPALLRTYRDLGISIGKGTIGRWLSDHNGLWAKEAEQIHLAGLATGDWHATDQTSTRVAGCNEVCHVVGNQLFTSYHTRKGASRLDVLAVLWNREPLFRLNEDAEAWLAETSISASLLSRLHSALPYDLELEAFELAAHLEAAGIQLNMQQRQQVYDALAVAAYHAQTDVPIVRQLLSDDAAVFHAITDRHALCWVHDGRHYAKLNPVIGEHQRALAAFRQEYWALYRALAAYRLSPSRPDRARLEAVFDQLMARRTGYDDLDARIAKTAYNRDLLLSVLDTPSLPLHNNDMELAARRRVRKRDVSFGPQSRAGARAWDTFQTIAATAAKQGVRLFEYLRERLTHPDTTPSLAERIIERSCAAALAPA